MEATEELVMPALLRSAAAAVVVVVVVLAAVAVSNPPFAEVAAGNSQYLATQAVNRPAHSIRERTRHARDDQ